MHVSHHDNLSAHPLLYFFQSLDLESVALFQDANPRCLTCVFSIPAGAIIEYDIRIKMRQTAFVTVVGKERGTGALYMATKEIDVSIGGCGG